MKFIHLSDLHIGKRVNEFSMLEDQTYILNQILHIIDDENPNGVWICGDVYDKPVPGAEAVQLFDDFLTRLAKRNLQVFVISGNHDSAERIAFGAGLMTVSGVHMSPVYDGKVAPTMLEDKTGKVAVYMLPFLKPAHVRKCFPDETIESYTQAMQVAVSHMELDENATNILLTHQFVTGAIRSESEETTVGGSDNVDGTVFEAFDYVALGHIHRPQTIFSDRIRYCGTPLKYSFSEAKDEKSVSVVTCEGKGNISVKTVLLTPKHDMRELKGTYEALTLKANYEHTKTDDYLHIILTDEEDIPDAVQRLRVIYPNVMKLSYDNRRTRKNADLSYTQETINKSPLQLFSEFYEKQNNQPMSDAQTEFTKELMEKIWRADV